MTWLGVAAYISNVPSVPMSSAVDVEGPSRVESMEDILKFGFCSCCNLCPVKFLLPNALTDLRQRPYQMRHIIVRARWTLVRSLSEVCACKYICIYVACMYACMYV